jgi:hypothetical protein
MKSTDHFKQVIKEHLVSKAIKDEAFEQKYKAEGKSLDDCITYILNTVKNSGANGFTDAEVFGMAVHYYDEASIDIGKEIKADVMINRHVELTPEEKEQARVKAVEQLTNEIKAKITAKKTPKPTPTSTEKDKAKETPKPTQQSLF